MPTPTSDIPPQYDPAATERTWYERWEAAGAFTAHAARSSNINPEHGRPPFTIVLPPPNVTAALHMGHGLNDTVQDVIIRWRRMAGDETLWLPGTDHAGIATQNVVERQLAKEGLSRFDVGRENFLERTSAFVESTGGTILKQIRAIGASCDWSRTHYTLSPELSDAVREAFIQLYDRGLIYRGKRVIHWCPRCLTALSDEEAEHVDEEGALYHISYPLADNPSQSVIVATTRPETLLGDVAVAVHPDDERYANLVGRTILLPIANVEIPVIADRYVDPTFGTGVVKITPAHDPNDFEVGRRHGLAMPVIMTPDGMMQNYEEAGQRVPPELLGVGRFEARERIVTMLKEMHRLVKVVPHQHAVRHCYRCNTVVEPRLSNQWFVKMAELAKPALDAVRSGTVRIVPERWEAVYVNWLENIRDWNISRQLWWGHRIPVWHCRDCGDYAVSRTPVDICKTCGGSVQQDEDVLDTWFSSWLWPFSTLGWPDKNAEDLRAFYPTDMLVTAPEILFFWVARMIMGGYAFMGKAPFHTVYLHGTVRDTNHVKMSKSLGNGIDPLDVVQLYGADALRYTVISGMGVGADLILDPTDLEKSFAPGRNFATKLWNIGRFLLQNVGTDTVAALDSIDSERLTRADRWILARLNAAIRECNAALGPARPSKETWDPNQLRAGLRLNEYAECARRFVWNELADWYLESTKSRLATATPDRDVARAVLVHVFDRALRLLHPVVPFITEDLWQRLPRANAKTTPPRPSTRSNPVPLPEFLCTSAWPAPGLDDAEAGAFDAIRHAVNAIRTLRSDYNVAPAKVLDVVITPRTSATVYHEEAALIGHLARAQVTIGDAPHNVAAAHAVLPDGSAVALPLEGIIDIAEECAKLQKELDGLEKQLDALSGRLSNPSFTSRAPSHVVDAERCKEREWSTRRDQMRAKIQSLCGT